MIQSQTFFFFFCGTCGKKGVCALAEYKMATQTSSLSCTNLVDPQEARDFIKRCIEKSGSTPEHAACLADVLIAADLRGHYSHGLNRLEMYVKEITNKQCDGVVKPVIVKETCATALVDAKNGIGMVGMESDFLLR